MDKPFIGQLNRKITIVRLEIDRTATGGEKTSEITVCEPYAKMDDGSGNEEVEGRVIHLINRSYVIRKRDDVNLNSTKLVLIDGSLRFEIYHVKEIGRTHLEILCKAYEY